MMNSHTKQQITLYSSGRRQSAISQISQPTRRATDSGLGGACASILLKSDRANYKTWRLNSEVIDTKSRTTVKPRKLTVEWDRAGFFGKSCGTIFYIDLYLRLEFNV